MSFEIYKITNKLSGKAYIGQTCRSIAERWYKHCSEKRNRPLSSAIRKHGKDSFSIELLASYKTLEELNQAEQFWIDHYCTLSPEGYNLDSGGNNGRRHSESTKKLISEKKKGCSVWNTGLRGTFQHTDEAKKKISRARRGSIPPNRQPVLCVETGVRYESAKEAANHLGCARNQISKVLIGANKTCKGFTFVRVV